MSPPPPPPPPPPPHPPTPPPTDVPKYHNAGIWSTDQKILCFMLKKNIKQLKIQDSNIVYSVEIQIFIFTSL